jgi:hypothetical protein
MIGTKTFYSVLSTLSYVSDTALSTVGLTSPIPAGARQKIRCWVPVTVGAAGGLQMQVILPAGVAYYEATIKLFNTIAPSLTTAIQSTNTAFTNALANAGSHWMEIEIVVVNGATAGVVDVQFAQNSSNATALQVLRGASMDVTQY